MASDGRWFWCTVPRFLFLLLVLILPSCGGESVHAASNGSQDSTAFLATMSSPRRLAPPSSCNYTSSFSSATRVRPVCQDVHVQKPANQCAFARAYCHSYKLGVVNYLVLHYCFFGGHHVLSFASMIILMVFLFWLLSTAAEHYFCPSLTQIARTFQMPANVAGVTLLALGNGSPDLIAIFVASSNNDTTLALGEPLGTGVFATTVIIACVTIVSPHLIVGRSFLTHISFYMLSLLSLYLICIEGRVRVWQSLFLMLFWGMYISFVLISNRLERKRREHELAAFADEGVVDPFASTPNHHQHAPLTKPLSIPLGYGMEKEEEEEEEEEEEQRVRIPLFGRKTSAPYRGHRPAMSLALAMYKIRRAISWEQKSLLKRLTFPLTGPVYLFLNLTVPIVEDGLWHRTFTVLMPPFSLLFLFLCCAPHQFASLTIPYTSFPLWFVLLLLGVALSIMIYAETNDDSPPPYMTVFVFWAFFMSVMWMYTSAGEVVSMLRSVGVILHQDDALLGLTVLAWGNGVSDLVANVVVARHGTYGAQMAVAACFAGPMLSILVGLSGSFLVSSVGTYPKPYLLDVTPSIKIAFLFQFFIIFVMILYVPLNGFQVTRRLGAALVCVYFLMMLVIVAEYFGPFGT